MTDRPDNLNDPEQWLDRRNVSEAIDALRNQVTAIVGGEQTARTLAFQRLNEQQRDYNEALAQRLELVVFSLRSDVHEFRAAFQEQLNVRFDAYGAELDAYRQQMQSLAALVEGALAGPFLETIARVETLEYGYAELADRVDAALDPNTPGATFEMVALHRRVDFLTRLVLALLALSLFLLLLLALHIWQMMRSLPALGWLVGP